LSNEKIVDFVCGDAHNLILTEGGKMWSFGWNINGQCGHGHTINVMIAKLVTRVQPFADQLTTCGAPDWLSIAAGMNHSLAVSQSGTIYTCGHNGQG
jgi:alpha-tubulin suppressor-like RCC1 family protein